MARPHASASSHNLSSSHVLSSSTEWLVEVATFSHGAASVAKLHIDIDVDMAVQGPLGIKPSAPG